MEKVSSFKSLKITSVGRAGYRPCICYPSSRLGIGRFSIKDQIVNIVGIAAHLSSLSYTLICFLFYQSYKKYETQLAGYTKNRLMTGLHHWSVF